MAKHLPATIAAVGLAVALLTGCGYKQGPDVTGTVTDKGGLGKRRHLTVEEPSGKEHRFRTTRPIFNACQVGDTWPTCKLGS